MFYHCTQVLGSNRDITERRGFSTLWFLIYKKIYVTDLQLSAITPDTKGIKSLG